MYLNKRIIALMLIMAVCAQLFCGCGKDDKVSDTTADLDNYEDEEWYDDEKLYDYEEPEEEIDQREDLTEETLDRALSGEGIVTSFISEQFYDGVINNEEEALDAVYSVLDRIGGDETTEFVFDALDSTEDGIDFYTFRQAVGTVSVYGASAKLITDRNKKAIGLVSAILPDLQAPPENIWSITGPEAEEIVKEECGDTNVRIYSKATGQTLIPLVEGNEQKVYVWVVYTDNKDASDAKNKVDAAYIAHYVSCDGEYLSSIPVSDVGNEEALSGSVATFAFKDMESDEWSGTVKTFAGKKKTIEIPIMVDPKTGEQYLGDKNRKILCGMQPDFEYEDTLTPCVSENGKWDDEYIITYYNFIQIYDLYETTGWVGPDGAKTPSLLLMGAENEEGSPLENACYSGKKQGFQVFEFDSASPYGECTDIMGHEFTHCVTGTLMTANLYLNDYGAINEAMSDILGNLAAIMVDEEDEPYVIGEKMPEGAARSMKDPNSHEQPGFVGDKYFAPAVVVGNDYNDNGGVHTNSSLLNYISYKLNQAGMEPEDEFYYWMNVARAMTSRTDYKQMARLLPWVMTTFGENDYVAAVEDAITQTGIDEMVFPDEPPAGLARVSFDMPGSDELSDKIVFVSFEEFDSEMTFMSWPGAGTEQVNATLPKGKYLIYITVNDQETGETTITVYDGGEWKTMGEEDFDVWMQEDCSMESFLNVTAGDVIYLEEVEIK